MSSDPIEVLRELEAKLNRLEDKYREAIKGRDAADPLTNHRLGLAEGFGVAAMCVRDALASLSAPKPDGEWVLVPREPSEAMLDAGKRCVTPLYVYDAMLAAAPKPPSVNDNAVAVNESAPVNDKPESAEVVFNCPTCPVSVQGRWREPDCPECGERCFVDPTAAPAPPRPEASDTGPWRVNQGGQHIASDDFKHDVALHISGDFSTPGELRRYAEALCAQLNAAPQQASAPVGTQE